MAMTPEGKVKKKIVEQLKALGCYKGKFFGIECKAGKNMPTALQEKNLREIGEAYGIACVINEDSMNDVELILGG